MPDFIIPLTEAAALDAERVGPKAANLAALARAGLPTPGGFCSTITAPSAANASAAARVAAAMSAGMGDTPSSTK